MALSQEQQLAADKFLAFLSSDTEHELVLQGYAGTGKTYLTKHLIDLARRKYKLFKFLDPAFNGSINIYCTATTHKAAKVFEDRIGEPVKTIHSQIGLQVYNDYATGTQKLRKTRDFQMQSNALLIIDEASMINDQLLEMIRECTIHCKILYIGDPRQLPPVKSTKSPVFTDIKNVISLTQIQRQANTSPIIELGANLREAVITGKFPSFDGYPSAIYKLTGAEFKSEVETHFTKDFDDSYKILAWRNDRVNQYNHHVRSMFISSPIIEEGEKVVTNNTILNGSFVEYPTDSLVTASKVRAGIMYDIPGHYILINDNVEVFQATNPAQVKQLMKTLYKQKNFVDYFAVKDSFADLRSPYASTVHKSQGSTYKKVFIDLSDISKNRKVNEVARLLYVATTRASDSVYFYGDLADKYLGG